ncbi:sigma-54 dependent transcriptional regulator [Geobacter sp. SVR]|uniref:sigma-54-dependent transcriptional regulator n=1 Tax=Geobacter sp. SVR TaxID=2495594 RepID=UPI00143EFE65|nr:sigma-54 dependent transcriptional regulator [Geobacter sp. SVR]BCS52000.1 sigma-54-dependent Fis family transcriptional regulator [Geobacter sp. SVR]GCF87185.1 sigma-54-dependent Fis family transcriptional regulator [Geobacter sp. SVR]
MKQPADNERSILVVDDNPDFLNEVRLMLISNGIKEVTTLSASTELLDALECGGVAVLLMDWMMPGLTGADLLPVIIERFPHIPVIIMTAVNDLQTVVGCIKQGAFDYITKPIDVNRLLSCIAKAFQINELARQNRRLKEYLLGNNLLQPEIFSGIVTANPRMQAIFKIVETMGGTHHPVLISGETGVGKELIARAIHQSSGLRGAFVPLNVAGLDDMMFADTLFGHKKGAFTGAHEPREGLIAKAEGGTLFLDEIGDLGSDSQVKLLRLLQEHEYYRLGSDALIKSNARIIAASNRDFGSLMQQGVFRRDLYHRLRNHHIHIPPLRERGDDIPLLIEHFLRKAATESGRPVPALTREARNALEAYDYPGNVRELANLIQHAVACDNSGILNLADFPGIDVSDGSGPRQLRIFRDGSYRLQMNFPAFPSIGIIEQMIIEEAIRISEGNKSHAADLLGISRPTLNRKLAEGSIRSATGVQERM